MRRISALGACIVWTVLLGAAGHVDRRPPTPGQDVRGSAPGVTALAGGQVATSVCGGVYTEGQADRGQAVYVAECQLCHLNNLRGDGFASGLVDRAFAVRWSGRDVGELYAITLSTMPQGAPAILSPQEYVDVTAFLLRANGYPVGDEELAADRTTLAGVRIPQDGC